MKKLTFVVSAILAALLCSCGGNKKNASNYPENFATIGDAGRVQYLMSRVEPDSLARLIIYGALGEAEGVKFDTLAIATNYAYEHLQGDNLDKFALEYDGLIERLPLPKKMRVYALAGSEDPQGLGYQLGLEYISSIREDHKKVADVEKELAEFKKACAGDKDTYRRFIIGFKTALKVDHGKDVSEEIYRRFINEPEQ